MGQPTAGAGAGAGDGAGAGAGAGTTGAAGAGAAVAAAGAAGTAAAVTGAACWGCWTCTGEPLGSAMMLPEESRRTRRSTDDLPLETSLSSSPTPLGRRTPSPPAAAAAGASNEGRERGRPRRAEGGGSAGGGGEGRRRRPPRSPRASNLVRAVLGLRRGNRRPHRAARGRGSSTHGERGRWVCAFGARVPGSRDSLLSLRPGPDSQALQKVPPGDPEGAPPPGSQVEPSPQLNET